jgi:hypothetical protein
MLTLSGLASNHDPVSTSWVAGITGRYDHTRPRILEAISWELFSPHLKHATQFASCLLLKAHAVGLIRTCVDIKWSFLFYPRLDYSGIALLIMGSFVPWLYYSFYCNPQPCFIYLIVICVLGIAAIIVSQWDMFATPQYRGVRAGEYM